MRPLEPNATRYRRGLAVLADAALAKNALERNPYHVYRRQDAQGATPQGRPVAVLKTPDEVQRYLGWNTQHDMRVWDSAAGRWLN